MRNLLVTCILSLLSFTHLNAQQPEWVASLAIDPEYYIGISSCAKSVPDYQSIATKKALSLIAEQIQTTVVSSNELYTTEHNFNFNEEFIQSVKTTSNITLQDYELFQAWEDSNTYFVYYRLSKQLYRDNLSLAYDNALDNCNLKSVDAEAFLSSQKIDEAISAYLEASKFLEGVISNSFIPEKYAMVVNEWNRIQSQILKILFDFQVQPVKEKLQLTKGVLSSTKFEVKTQYTGQDSPIDLENIPVIFDLSGNITAFELKVVNSDNEGVASNYLVNIYNESLAYTIYCKIDFAGYMKRFDEYEILKSSEFSNLISNCKILVEVIPVIVVINSSENTYSEKNSSTVIRNELGNYLRSQNVSVQDNERKCDYIINLDANTRQGNHYEDVYSAFLDVEYKIYKNSSDSLVVSGNMEPVKGVSLNYKSAAAQAYKNAKEEVRPKLGKEILPYLK